MLKNTKENQNTMENNQEQVTNETNEQVTESAPKTFTQEQVNSIAANRALKERDIMYNELGLGDKYSKTALDNFITEAKTAKENYNLSQDEISKYKEQINTITAEKTSVEEQLMFNKFGVKEEFQDEFKTLVQSKINDDTDLMSAAQIVSEKFKGSLTASNKPVDIVIGKDKTTSNSENTMAKEMERLRNL